MFVIFLVSILIALVACDTSGDIGNIIDETDKIIDSGPIIETKHNDAEGTWLKKESDRDDGPPFIINLEFVEYEDEQEVKRVIDNYQYGRTGASSDIFVQAGEFRENNEKVYMFIKGKERTLKAAIISDDENGNNLLSQARNKEGSNFDDFIKSLIAESEDVVYGVIESESQLIEVESDPSKGFNWNYYVYIPESFDPDDNSDYTNHILLRNNYPDVSNDPEEYNSSAKNMAQRSQVGEELGIPIIVPAIPRPDNIDGATEPASHHFTTRLDRNTLSLHLNEGVDEKYHRLDQQIVYMLDDALDRLADKDIYLDDKVFTWGYSALGHFTNRFSKLHPERVQASVSGGIAVITLPEYERNDVDLYFPVGVYDLLELTDKEFDMEAYKDIPQFIFRGKADGGDALSGDNTIDERERDKYEKAVETKTLYDDELAWTEEGLQIMIDRMNKVEDIYNINNIPAQFRLYEGVEHEMTTEIYDDIVEFFKNNAGNELNRID